MTLPFTLYIADQMPLLQIDFTGLVPIDEHTLTSALPSTPLLQGCLSRLAPSYDIHLHLDLSCG